MANILEAETEDSFIQSLLLDTNASQEEGDLAGMGLFPGQLSQNTQKTAASKTVVPKPGFCVKTKDDTGEKVFINICHAENMPKPKDITEEELVRLVESEDASNFRIPMSLGEPHAEVDKGGQGCTAYDIVVHQDFHQKLHTSPVMNGFFLELVLEGLEEKYKLRLDRGWKLLKNRRFLGSMPEQNIRTKSKPWIQDIGGDNSQPSKSLISEVSSSVSQQPEKPRAPEPAYVIMQEPADSYPEFLVAEIHLPKVKSAASVTVDLGEDRILLETRSNMYHLDIYLPYNVQQDDCGCQYNSSTKILTITMPVVPES